MTFPDPPQAVVTLATVLGQTSLQVALLAAVVWVVCRACPLMPATVRTALWWLVCAKVLVGLVWIQPIRLPILPEGSLSTIHDGFGPSHATRVGRDPDELGPGELGSSVEPLYIRHGASITEGSPPLPARSESGSSVASRGALWPAVLLALVTAWLAGVGWHLGRTFVEWRRLHDLRRRARAAPAGLTERLASLASVVGLSRVPQCRLSDHVSTAQVIAVWNPVVLLPAPLVGTLTTAETEMTLCHELVHLKRRDLWWGLVPAVAERLLFFHPLVRIAAREYALAREAACDVAVLRLLDAPADRYGRLLVTFGIDAPRHGPATTGASSSSFRVLKRRLLMLESATRHSTPRHPTRWWAVALVTLIALVPIHVASQPTSSAPPDTSAEAWVLLDDDHTSTSNASHDEVAEAKRLRDEDGGPLLWFRRGETRYVVRDPTTLHEVETLFVPMRELGLQQAALGTEQARLGEVQAALGAQQAELGSQQAALGAMIGGRQAQLLRAQADRLDRQAAKADVAAVTDATLRAREAEAHQARQQLDEEMRMLGARQRALGAEQRDLGLRQGELGAKQRALGEQQREAGQTARRELSALMDRAIAEGLAHEVR